MADLFTRLAQKVPASAAVQPRLKTRFEDSAFESAGEPQESTPDDTESSQQADRNPTHQGRILRAGSQTGHTATGIQTIRETTTTPGRQTPAFADHAPVTPGQHSDVTQPDQADLPAAGKPVPYVARQPLATVPKTRLEEGETILPGANQPAVTVAPERQAPPPEKPQVMPATPVVESTPPPSDQAPTIEIHIGRVELRQAESHVQKTATARPRFEPKVSLSDYLARRNGGSE